MKMSPSPCFLLVTLALESLLGACSGHDKEPTATRPYVRIVPSEHIYYDLTENNYIALESDIKCFPPSDDACSPKLGCRLNGEDVPCDAYYAALPFGRNVFEVGYPEEAPLAMTEFTVCRRTGEIELAVGPGGEVGTIDDQLIETRTITWENGWSTGNVIEGSAWSTRETENFLEPTIREVLRYENGIYSRREAISYTTNGRRLKIERYSPEGTTISHTEIHYAFREAQIPRYRHFPAEEVNFSSPGSDGTWETVDDLVGDYTRYYKIGFTEPTQIYDSILATPDKTFGETAYFYPVTHAPYWQLKLRTVIDELHMPDTQRPGLRQRSYIARISPAPYRRELLAYRDYVYKCTP